MALNDKQKEQLLSIHSAAADIQRWAIQQLSAERISRDRIHDIKNQSSHIYETAKKAWDGK